MPAQIGLWVVISLRETIKLLAALVVLCEGASVGAPISLVPRFGLWAYHAITPPPTAEWPLPEFLAFWPEGYAPLGYGDNDVETVLFGNSDDAPDTLYFRKSFAVTNRAALLSLTLRLMADDGAVVYLNGVEIARRHLPAGPPQSTTPASVNVESNENAFVQFGVPVSRLVTGQNVVAVELHQHPAGRHDAAFDLELLANLPSGDPSVAITSPQDGAVLPAGPVTLQANASDTDGHIARVEFFTNGVLVGFVTAEPYTFVWTNPPAGRYLVTVRAYDERNRLGVCPAIHLQIGGMSGPPLLVRGPYLQLGSATGMVVRWRTDWFTDSVLRWGAAPDALTQAVTNSAPVTEHELKVTGLPSDTVWFYSVGSSSGTLAGGPEFHFRTSPTNARPVRLWVIGDSGSADQNAAAVRDSHLAADGLATDVWLTLGDNVYGQASDHDFQLAVFDMYPTLLRQTVVWPALGNHDANDSLPGYFTPYLEAFSLPKNGEAGGLPSGSELYYSFDYANIHFICLDSFTTDRSPHGAMLTWLEQDLAATDKDWILAYWHHPAYSFGGHNSDADSLQTEMRQNVLPMLEAYGVDLVLSGHSHEYERSFLLNGHYGYSWQLHPSMILDGGSGAGDDGPYRKPAGGMGAGGGTVYTVCGCSGQGGDGAPELHPAMAVAYGGFGSMQIEVDGLRLRARFLRPSGQYDDEFIIDKTAPVTSGPRLELSRESNGTRISWPTSVPMFVPEAAERLPATEWLPVTEPVATRGRTKVISISTNHPERYFRLRAAPGP